MSGDGTSNPQSTLTAGQKLEIIEYVRERLPKLFNVALISSVISGAIVWFSQDFAQMKAKAEWAEEKGRMSQMVEDLDRLQEQARIDVENKRKEMADYAKQADDAVTKLRATTQSADVAKLLGDAEKFTREVKDALLKQPHFDRFKRSIEVGEFKVNQNVIAGRDVVIPVRLPPGVFSKKPHVYLSTGSLAVEVHGSSKANPTFGYEIKPAVTGPDEFEIRVTMSGPTQSYILSMSGTWIAVGE